MENCIFCRILRDSKMMKVYEDDWSAAFMDIAQDVDGHIIAIPKQHVKSLLDCDSALLGKLMDCVKIVSNHLVDHCGYDGVNLLNASEESAGQSVPHFHIHIIPRKCNDGIDAWPIFDGAKEETEHIWKKIKMD